MGYIRAAKKYHNKNCIPQVKVFTEYSTVIFSTVIITQGLTVQILWRKLLWNTKKFSLEGFQSRRPVYATGWRWKGTYFSTDTS